jgi:two-component system, NarL family, invasion response regulator UvrY
MIKVLITDDHPVVRQGIRQILNTCPEVVFVDEASDGSEMLSKMHQEQYNVLLLDISMPGRNGLDLLKEVKNIYPGTAVLMLSIHPEEQYAIRAFKLGASGYLTKSSVPEELISAVLKVAQGKNYLSSSLQDKIGSFFDASKEEKQHNLLSERELQVMCMLAEGKKPQQIADELSVSPKTVATYRERILEKMAMKSTAEIIKYAIQSGLVE